MKLTCQQESLKKGLAQINRAVTTKTHLPILQNVWLSTNEEGRLCLKATDLEIGITIFIGARVEVEGGITVPAKLFTDLISKLPPEKIQLTVDYEAMVLKIKCERFSANLKGVTVEDFPPIPTVKEGALPFLTISPDILRQGLEQVAFAASTDESRPVLTGVLLRPELGSEDEGEGDLVTLAAADGFRLAVRKLMIRSNSINREELRRADFDAELFDGKSWRTAKQEVGHFDQFDQEEEEEEEEDVVATPPEFIVPGKTCNTLIHLLKECEDEIEVFLTTSGNQIIFKSTLIEIIGQLIDGKFPDFERIIPTEYTTRSLMETSELLKAVKLAALFANISQNIVKLVSHSGDDVSPGKLVISANAAELGDNTGEVDGIVHGEWGQVATNVKYLTDALNAIGTAQVAIETQTAQSPVVFKPVGNSNLLQIVMPMTLRG